MELTPAVGFQAGSAHYNSVVQTGVAPTWCPLTAKDSPAGHDQMVRAASALLRRRWSWVSGFEAGKTHGILSEARGIRQGVRSRAIIITLEC